MILIAPVTITDAMLTSTDVAEADYAEFAMNTTYAVGDRVMDSTGVEILTLDVAPATAWVKNRLITGQTSAKTCRVVAKLTNTTYQVRERSGAFTLGEVIGVTGTPTELADQGAAFPTFTAPTDKVHKIYESLAAANLSNYPPTDVLVVVPKWVEVSATNRWKIFDQVVGTQTEKATSFTYRLTPGQVINAIAFINMDCAEITITQTDPVEGIVYSATKSMIVTVITGAAIVTDWYTYFFSSGLKVLDYVDFNIPPYLNSYFDITVSYPLGTAKAGVIILGMQTIIGTTRYSPSVGIQDYSIKTQDAWGNYTITQRAFSKRLSASLRMPNESVSEIQRILALYRATPVVWVASNLYSALIVYGFYKDFNIVIPYPNYADCSIEIEGLT